jgi:hypothetical protein
MNSSNEKANKIEQILNDVSKRVEKLEQGINEFKIGFKDVGDVEEETVTTPTPSSDVKGWVTNKDIKF